MQQLLPPQGPPPRNARVAGLNDLSMAMNVPVVAQQPERIVKSVPAVAQRPQRIMRNVLAAVPAGKKMAAPNRVPNHARKAVALRKVRVVRVAVLDGADGQELRICVSRSHS